jgi:hypothetical protein
MTEERFAGYPNIISVIRMYREERGYSYTQARDAAIAQFRELGWPIPDGIASLEGRQPIRDLDKKLETL